jgi:hypothetical protein
MPEVLAVEHADDASAPPRAPCDDVGDGAQLDPVGDDAERIERDALDHRTIDTVTERAMQISRRHRQWRYRATVDELSELRVRGDDDEPIRPGDPFAPFVVLANGHRSDSGRWR